jgi:hypothetical protein
VKLSLNEFEPDKVTSDSSTVSIIHMDDHWSPSEPTVPFVAAAIPAIFYFLFAVF